MGSTTILAVVAGYDRLVPYVMIFFGALIVIGIPLKIFKVLKGNKK